MSMISLNVIAVTDTPYKGQQTRSIKALSDEQIKGYLGGKGMGYAKAAELNHYPGPKHVLELSEKLQLNPDQIVKTKAIFNKMKEQATRYGKQLVDMETELDRLFSSQKVDEENMNTLLMDIGKIQAKLRTAHLAAHLEQRALLSEHQIKHYDQLRGYGAGQHSHHHNH